MVVGSMFGKKKRPTQSGGFTRGPGQGPLDPSLERVSADHLMAMDGFLHTYDQEDIDWRAIWSEANRRRDGIPPFGVLPYWTPRGPGGAPRPLSNLAFMGVPSRLRIAQDPSTKSEPSILAAMVGDLWLTGEPDPKSGDPDARVFQAAARAYPAVADDLRARRR